MIHQFRHPVDVHLHPSRQLVGTGQGDGPAAAAVALLFDGCGGRGRGGRTRDPAEIRTVVQIAEWHCLLEGRRPIFRPRTCVMMCHSFQQVFSGMVRTHRRGYGQVRMVEMLSVVLHKGL